AQRARRGALFSGSACYVGRGFLQCIDACEGRLGCDARRAHSVCDYDVVGAAGHLAGILYAAYGRREMMSTRTLTLTLLAILLSACGDEPGPLQVGANPELPDPKRGILPNMTIAEPTEWGDRTPTVPEGYTITAIAKDLKIPRQTLVLPNGDILVAEGRGGNAPALKPKDIIAGVIKAKGTTSVESGNQLTLLRDADGDGVYELRTVFADNLNAPYGLAMIGNTLYVANQDELVRFEYQEGQTQASGPPESVTLLPSDINHHWTKALTAGADGRFLYVGIGSNSNI